MAVTDGFPADWSRGSLRDVATIQAGPSNITKDLLPPGEAGRPVLSPSEIRWFGIATEPARSVSRASADRLERFAIRAGDLVCVRTGDLGRAALVGPAHEGWILGTSCLRLTLAKPVNPGYVLRYLAHPEVRAWIKENARYSTIPSLSTQVLGDLPFVVAPPEFQTAISDVLGALEEKIAAHRALVAECERLHKWLLPKLMSGQPLES
jgi:type I restriction enzyme S subunit